MHRLVAVLAIVLLAPSVAGADCMLMGLQPTVVMATNDGLTEGGILVAATSVERGALEKGDAAVQRGWRLRTGAGVVKPRIDVLAPGLAVYRVNGNGPTYELLDDTRTVVAKATLVKAKLAPYLAPKIKSAHYEQPMSRRSLRQIVIELDGSAPENAYALVLADAKGKARSWGLAKPGSTQTPYESRDCITLPNGTLASNVGDKITVFWVDRDGRRSAASKPITVAARRQLSPKP